MSNVRSIASEHKVLVICVNYYNEEDTHGFVSSLLSQRCSGSLQVVVIDNSGKESLNPLLIDLATDSRVNILNPGGNLGYFGGAAWGLKNFSASEPLPDWVIVANTDMSFPNGDFFNKLFSCYPHGFKGVLVPSIYSTLSETDQNPYMLSRPKAVRMHFYKWVFRFYPISTAYQVLAFVIKKLLTLIRRKKTTLASCQENREVLQPQRIYAPHGSFIIFHRSYFEEGGNLEHGVFLFGEEVFVAETTRRLGLNILYDPRLIVLHREHATTGTFKNRKIARFVREATTYCADEFFC